MKGTLKRCPSCGKYFTCMGEADCWCESYQIHRKEYLKLSAKFHDCICQQCLLQYAEK
jgi:hypothetical protein